MSDKFFVPGRVSPSEYDWEAQFSSVAKDFIKNPVAFMPLDVGKVMGLCAELARLKTERDKLREQVRKYKETMLTIFDDAR